MQKNVFIKYIKREREKNTFDAVIILIIICKCVLINAKKNK